MFSRIFEPKLKISEDRKMFSGRDLYKILLPLFIEQFLVMLVGIVDTMMISYAGDAAVSGVSLVNQYNTIFIYIFSALAAGGAVVLSQYIGSRNKKKADHSAGQLMVISIMISVVLMLLSVLFYRQILGTLFGKVEKDVMDACVTYLLISAYSYPAMAIYNAGAAIYRSMGKTKVTMYISFAANGINIVGNAIGIFVLNAGVAGVAYPSLISRVFQAIVIVWLCFRIPDKKNREDGSSDVPVVRLSFSNIFSFDWSMIKRILGIAIPNGVENGIFQIVKVVLSSIVALFGTAQIAANGVGQSIWSMAALATVSFSIAMTTVAGQCMGADDTEAAEYYIRKLTRITIVTAVAWNAFILAITPLMLKLYALSPEAGRYTLILVIIHNIFNGFVLPLSSIIGNGVRAAGDVKFAMITTITTTLAVRMVFSYILGVTLGLGVFGVAIAMCMEWTAKGTVFVIRLNSGKWKQFKVI